ncbi:MAG: TraR/DksA family transcriptional regulator [Nitrospinae bacterium]|nr:TraR/DksA family transcriptional regulator [Nitrospinota bacterium]
MKKTDFTEIKKILKKRRALLLHTDKNLDKDIQGEIEERHGDDVDIAEADTERELSFFLKNKGQGEIKLIDEALDRIEQGEYGVCGECGEDIPKKRLEVLPYSIYCVNCQSQIESQAEMSASE